MDDFGNRYPSEGVGQQWAAEKRGLALWVEGYQGAIVEGAGNSNLSEGVGQQRVAEPEQAGKEGQELFQVTQRRLGVGSQHMG